MERMAFSVTVVGLVFIPSSNDVFTPSIEKRYLTPESPCRDESMSPGKRMLLSRSPMSANVSYQ